MIRIMENSFIPNKTVLITGANGQLGREFQLLANAYPHYTFLFTTKEDLPIDDFGLIEKFFDSYMVDYCINCAAYTAVDKAETEKDKAFLINSDAVGNLAQICNQHHTRFIHISTDYVFNGSSSIPYTEEDATDPINTYGASKFRGEELAFKNNSSTLVIRTSWVYSSFGNNFVKTMLRLMNEKDNISVVDDQYGCPTYAADLATAILKIIDQSAIKTLSGIFNYCNEGVITWYQFAFAINGLIKSNCRINPIPSSEYITAAKRPQYSVLDTTKIRQSINIHIPHWEESLQKCLLALS